jgi:hypothetical protein
VKYIGCATSTATACWCSMCCAEPCRLQLTLPVTSLSHLVFAQLGLQLLAAGLEFAPLACSCLCLSPAGAYEATVAAGPVGRRLVRQGG